MLWNHFVTRSFSDLYLSGSLLNRPDRKRGCLGYRGFFFSNFYKSVFSIFTYSEYRKLGFQKSEIFKHLSKTGISNIREYRKHGCLKISDFKHLSSEYRKLRFQKIRGFQTSVFSIFTYSEYWKYGCLKISDFKHLSGEYRKLRFKKNPRFSNIRVFDIHL